MVYPSGNEVGTSDELQSTYKLDVQASISNAMNFAMEPLSRARNLLVEDEEQSGRAEDLRINTGNIEAHLSNMEMELVGQGRVGELERYVAEIENELTELEEVADDLGIADNDVAREVTDGVERLRDYLQEITQALNDGRKSETEDPRLMLARLLLDVKAEDLQKSPPWHVENRADQAPEKDKPWAVVVNETGEAVQWHESQAKAETAVRALYANVGKKEKESGSY
jgi:polyhydroxyalkanoate synthesis regulator phasin